MNDDGEPVKGDNGMTPKKKPLDDVGSMDGNVSKLDGVGADGVTVEKDGGNDPAGVPIGQLCYGHDGESLSGSPSLDYSGSLDDSGHAFTAGGELFWEACFCVLRTCGLDLHSFFM
jgi:hypothetical protein